MSDNNTAAIVLGVLAGVFVIGLLIVFGMKYRNRSRQSASQSPVSERWAESHPNTTSSYQQQQELNRAREDDNEYMY